MTKPASIEPAFGYIRCLDGVRAVSVLLVVAGHFTHSAAQRGELPGFGTLPGAKIGVTAFFFISGFLITRLFLAEAQEMKKISLKNFYFRRFLRLAPPLLTMIAVVSTLYFVLFGVKSPYEVLAAVFYSINYYYVFANWHLPFGQLWSLAVEEHYYLLFPLLFVLLSKNNRRFLRILTCVCAAVLLWRIAIVYFGGHFVSAPLIDRMNYTYGATDCRIDSILFGAILSLLTKPSESRILSSLMSLWVFGGACVLLVLATLFGSAQFASTFRYSLQGVAFIPIFACIVFGARFGLVRACLENKALVWVGKLSYSIYLWHLPVLFVLDHVTSLSFASWLALYLSITLLAAASSYYLLERPLSKLRGRLRSHRPPPEEERFETDGQGKRFHASQPRPAPFAPASETNQEANLHADR